MALYYSYIGYSNRNVSLRPPIYVLLKKEWERDVPVKRRINVADVVLQEKQGHNWYCAQT